MYMYAYIKSYNTYIQIINIYTSTAGVADVPSLAARLIDVCSDSDASPYL